MGQRNCNILPLSPKSLPFVGQWLRKGNVAALPTETVYGLAGNGYDETAIARIFSLKNRPQFNPLILHYAQIEEIAKDVLFNPTALLLAEQFWPGPLTLVLPRAPQTRVPLLASAGQPTLAVRIPQSLFWEALITQEGFPLAAPSANRSGHISSTTSLHVLKSLEEKVGLVVDGGPCERGIESTILDLTTPTPFLLRAGALPVEQIEAFLEKPVRTQKPTPHPLAPGQLTSHYAPRQSVRLNATSVASDEGLLAFGPVVCAGAAALTLNLSERGDLMEAAAHLFSHLHVLEMADVRQIAVMPIPNIGLGKAINDRLSRAAAARFPI